MNKIKEFIKNDVKCRPSKQLVVASITLLIMWICYYIDQSGRFEGNSIWEVGIWGFGIIVVLNVWFPAWWIVIRNKEGFSGLGITKHKLGLALIFSVLLGGWRFIELIPYLDSKGLVAVLLFNLLSIWEVCFIYSWLYNCYEKSFGKIIAVFLTAFSVGLYHIGSLTLENILYLMLCIVICSICFAITKNIVTVWPIYWVIGCSASVLKSFGAEHFPMELVYMMGIVIVLQLGFLFYLKLRMRKRIANK